MNSAAMVEAFLEMMSAERGAADNTLASYRRDLDDAGEHLGGEPGGLAGASSAGQVGPLPVQISLRSHASPDPIRHTTAAG